MGEVVAGGAVDHAVVDLADQGELFTALDALDDPDLPERPGAVERVRHDAGADLFELIEGARAR